jgi:cell division protein FtsN
MANNPSRAYHSQPMANDFANRLNPATTRRTKARPASRGKRRERRFSGSSFGAGLLIGGACMAVALNLWELEPERRPTAGATAETAPPESVTFEFDEDLRAAHVEADPGQYETDAGHGGSRRMSYLIQAASFTSAADAGSLQAQLEGLALPVRSEPVQLGARTWFRVTVGPFDSQLKANRALTQLREIDLDAFMIKQRLHDPD